MTLAGRWDCEDCGEPYDGDQSPMCDCYSTERPYPELAELTAEWHESADEELYPEGSMDEG